VCKDTDSEFTDKDGWMNYTAKLTVLQVLAKNLVCHAYPAGTHSSTVTSSRIDEKVDSDINKKQRKESYSRK